MSSLVIGTAIAAAFILSIDKFPGPVTAIYKFDSALKLVKILLKKLLLVLICSGHRIDRVIRIRLPSNADKGF